jgi:hypothetical protein
VALRWAPVAPLGLCVGRPNEPPPPKRLASAGNPTTDNTTIAAARVRLRAPRIGLGSNRWLEVGMRGPDEQCPDESGKDWAVGVGRMKDLLKIDSFA